MNIVNKKITELKPYEKNPRFNDDTVKYVANSIKIPKNHVCFFIEKFVDCVDFSEIDFQYVDTPGQKAYLNT